MRKIGGPTGKAKALFFNDLQKVGAKSMVLDINILAFELPHFFGIHKALDAGFRQTPVVCSSDLPYKFVPVVRKNTISRLKFSSVAILKAPIRSFLIARALTAPNKTETHVNVVRK